MTATNVVNEYITIINKLEELRLLLKKKLIQLKVIDSSGFIDGNNVTFPKLLTKVNPIDIHSIVNKQLPNQPVDLTDDFVTDFKINGRLNSQYSIEDFNSLLIDKLNFYREYLMYQLENMGISKSEINQAITIKNLILLLDKVDKIKTIDDIICEDTTIYVNQRNVLDVYVYDETSTKVETGTLEIYENNVCIYCENIGEEVTIAPTTIGEHTYNFKYVNKIKGTDTTINKYMTSELFSITIDVVYPPLEGSFTIQNVNRTSRYYTGNEDDFIGYVNDLWDIDVNIFDINQESINQPIPFNIYIYDHYHSVISGVTDTTGHGGVTDTTGHAKLTSVPITYTNSDFIDFRESAVTNFKDEEPINTNISDKIDITANRSVLSYADKDMDVPDSENPGKAIFKISVFEDGEPAEGQLVSLYSTDKESTSTNISNEADIDLSFIKAPTFVDGKVTYKRVIFTKNNYLDDLNGCVTDIRLVGDTLEYTTFSTSNHTLISEINDIPTTLGNLVTEVFYKDNNVTYETLTNKRYDYDKQNADYTVPLILKTKLDAPEYPNVELKHDIIIYHIPLHIDSDLIYYKGDPNGLSHIPITLRDKETNQPLTYLDQQYKLNINGTDYIMESPTFDYTDISDLPYGESDLNVTLYENNIEVASLYETITVLSNFELPSQTIYYIPDTPDIYYKPKGTVAQNKQVIINNTTYYTNANGLLHALKGDLTIGTHNITLIANSDDLTEQKSFSYELKEPFTITRTNYDQHIGATYQIIFYDKEHIPWDSNNFNIDDYITVINDDNNVLYTYTSSYTTNSATYDITINKSNSSVGTNILTVTANGYTETQTFDISSEHLYELFTTEAQLGDNKSIEIYCHNPNIDTVILSGTGITQNSVTKNGDVFTVICNLSQAAPNGMTISMTDGTITETATLTIPKANIDVELGILHQSRYITSFPIGQSSDLFLIYDFYTIASTDNNKILIINDGIDDHTITIPSQTTSTGGIIFNFKDTNRAPGTYTATLTYNGDSNFNSFTTSFTYTITADNCRLTLIPSSDPFIDDSHTSVTLTATYTYNSGLPIPNAQLDLVIGASTVGTPNDAPLKLDTKTTNQNGEVNFTVNSANKYSAIAMSENSILCASNTLNIRGVVDESAEHVPQNPIVLESNRIYLSYADLDNSLPDSENPGKAIITATIYDQDGNKIKNREVNFYIEDEITW